MTGRTIAHYQVLEKLGEGGMGVVYKARDTHLDRFVALKVLPPEKMADPERKRRFVQEAKAASALNHPNIVVVHDIATEAGHHFIVMEYVAGKTLDQLIGRKGLRLGEALKYAVQIADALVRAHSAGIVHRDLKPSNIMVDEHGLVKVLDFGLAKLTERAVGDEAPTETLRPRTEEGTIVGTAAYMSPEQAEGKRSDARGDIFSFGAVLYEMLSGRRAFQGDSRLSTLSAILREEPAPLGAEIPHELHKIVSRCVRKDPERRHQHMDEVKLALLEVKEETESGAAAAVPVARRPRRGLWLATAALLALLALAAVAWLRFVRSPPAAMSSVAVLPFHNLSQDKEDEFLSDGLADDIAHALTRNSGLRVVAGASARTFRGKELDLPEVGSKLRVGHVLEGNLRKSGNRIRVTVQLHRVSDSSLLWGRNYDREMAGFVAVPDDVARSIAGELRLKPAGGHRALRRHTANTEAYQFYLKGRYYHQRQSAETLPRSKECFEQAIALDSKYAPAHYGLAEYYWSQSFYASGPPRDLLIRGKAAAVKALELDDTLAEAHAMLGIFRALLDFDWQGGEQEFRRALELDPGSTMSRDRYALYLLPALGRLDEAVAEMNTVVESDPLSVYYQYHLSVVLTAAREFERAIQVSRSALALDPSAWLPHQGLGMAYYYKRMHNEAIRAFEKALELSGNQPNPAARLAQSYAASGRRSEAQKLLRELEARRVSAVLLAGVYLELADKGRALELIAKAVEDREPQVLAVPVDPRWDPLRADPRYRALLRKMKLEPPL